MRSHGVLRGLAQVADVHVALAADDPDAVAAFLHVQTGIPGIERSVLKADTFWAKTPDPALVRSLGAILSLSKYHGAFLDLVSSLAPQIIWYFEAESVRLTGLAHGIPAVLDHVDVRWRKQLRVARRAGGPHRCAAYLKALVLWADDVFLSAQARSNLVASPDETRLLWPVHGVSVLPNGYDFPVSLPNGPPREASLLFFGSLFYEPNRDGIEWLCREIWPSVAASYPGAHLDVVGLGGDRLAEVYSSDTVTFHGFVDDLDPLISRAAALVVPLRIAGGTRIKILEAWAKGLPVVSTTIGAEGLETRQGDTLLLADDAASFAQRCVFLLSNTKFGEGLAARAFVHAQKTYDWPRIHSNLAEMLEGLCESTTWGD